MADVGGQRDADGTTAAEPSWDVVISADNCEVVVISADSCEVVRVGEGAPVPVAQHDGAKVHATGPCPDATEEQFKFTQDNFWDDLLDIRGWKRRLQTVLDSLLFVPERTDGCESLMRIRSLQPLGEPALLRREDCVMPKPGQLAVIVWRMVALTFAYCIPVAIAAISPVILSGLTMRVVSQEARVPGSSLKNLETDVQNAKVGLRILWLTTLPRFWDSIAVVGLWCIHVFAPYKGRYLRNLFWKTEGVHLIVNVIWYACRPSVYQAIGDSQACSVLSWAITFSNMGWYALGSLVFHYCSLAHVGSRCSGIVFCGVLSNGLLVYIVLQEVFGYVLVLPPGLKVCVLGIGVPLVFQLLIHAPMRMVARTLPNIDPIIRFVTLSVSLPYEKFVTRILIMTIKDLYWVTFACILSASVGGLARLCLGTDDFRFYQLLKRIGARGDPDAVLSHPENYYLQSTTSLLEVVCDIAAICCAASVQLSYGVESSPGVQPSVVVVMRNAALQTGLKVATFVFTIGYAYFGKREDFAGIVRRMPVKWLICPVVISLWTGANLTCVWMPLLICVPKTGDAYWAWCIS